MTPEVQALVREAVRAVALIVAVSIVMLGLLALKDDGQIAQTIAGQLEAAISWGLPVIGGIIVILQLASAYTGGKGGPRDGNPS